MEAARKERNEERGTDRERCKMGMNMRERDEGGVYSQDVLETSRIDIHEIDTK